MTEVETKKRVAKPRKPRVPKVPKGFEPSLRIGDATYRARADRFRTSLAGSLPFQLYQIRAVSVEVRARAEAIRGGIRATVNVMQGAA
jgi:hypothetical protein